MERLNIGTKELVSVNVTDRLANVNSLESYAVEFKIRQNGDTTKVDWTAAAQIVGMRVDCLIDTANWDEDKYYLYVRPTIGSETPIIGPFEFEAIA